MSMQKEVFEAVEKLLAAGDTLADLSKKMLVTDIAKYPKTVEAFATVLDNLTVLMSAYIEDTTGEKFPAVGAN